MCNSSLNKKCCEITISIIFLTQSYIYIYYFSLQILEQVSRGNRHRPTKGQLESPGIRFPNLEQWMGIGLEHSL